LDYSFEGEVRAVAFNANSDTIITGGTDDEALVWDILSGKRVGSLDGHRGDVLAVAISPDGSIALTGCADKKARLWDLAERTCRKIVDHQGAVRTVGFHPDGRSFFVGGDNEASDKGTLCIMTEYDAPYVLATESDAKYSITSAAYSPDGATLLVGDENWEASFYDAASLRRFATTDYAFGQVRGVAFSPDSKTALIGASDSNMALLWNMESLRAYVDWQKDGVFVLTNVGPPGPIRPALLHPQPVTAVCFSPSDGQRILTACEDGCVRIWHKSPGPSIRVLDHNPTLPIRKKREFVVQTTAIDPSGRLAATAGDNGQVVLWDVSNATRNGRALDCSSPVVSVVFTSDGRSVVTGSKDGLVQLWNLRTREREGEPIHHEGGVSGLDICRSNDEILVGGGGLAQRWNVRSGVKIGDPLQHSNDSALNITTAISPNSKRFLTMGEDGTAKLWNASAGLVAVLTHDNSIGGGAFSRDSTQAITASHDGTARVWDASNGTLLASLTHQSEVFSAAFVSASRAITCSRQGAQVWDLRFQKRLGAPFKGQHGIFLGTRVLFAACSDDGETAVLADFNGYGVIWSMPKPVSNECSSITVWVQTEVGMKLDEAGGRQVLTAQEWLQNDAIIGPRR
jgi:WD40 repeat protein